MSSSSSSESSSSSSTEIRTSSSSADDYRTVYPILDIYHVGITSMRPPNDEIVGSPVYYHGYYAFDPSKSLVGAAIGNCWQSYLRERYNQRIWADLGTPFIIQRLYYENYHNYGGSVNDGAYEGSIWGSNITPEAYGTYEGLTFLWRGQFQRHSANNTSDPHYIWLNNIQHYRYYIIDIDNNYSGNVGVGFRRLEWQEGIIGLSSSSSSD
jgi:hypothetical protein